MPTCNMPRPIFRWHGVPSIPDDLRPAPPSHYGQKHIYSGVTGLPPSVFVSKSSIQTNILCFQVILEYLKMQVKIAANLSLSGKTIWGQTEQMTTGHGMQPARAFADLMPAV